MKNVSKHIRLRFLVDSVQHRIVASIAILLPSIYTFPMLEVSTDDDSRVEESFVQYYTMRSPIGYDLG